MNKKVTIEKFDYEGNGISKIPEENKIIFVNDALPGEEVEIFVNETNKNFDRASIVNYINKSDRRIENPCKYKTCGGCDLLHINYDYELEFKENKVKEIFLKNNHLTCIEKIVPSPKIFNYRNKITLRIKNGKLSLYEKDSHDLVNINKCLLVNDRINEIINQLNNVNLENTDEIIIRSAEEILLIVKSKMNVKKQFENLNVDNIILINNDKTHIIKGKNYIIDNLENIKYKISEDSFFQVNKEQTINIYNKIIELAEFKNNETVLDLYCGIGSISLFIAPFVKKVIGIEINKTSIKDAEDNMKLNSIKNVEFKCQNANQIKIDFKPDIIIVDPPRSGLDSKTINIIKDLKSSKIIYMSCNPLTLARDINLLKNLYSIENIIPFDMFPKTQHVECLSLFNLKDYKG